MELHTMNCFKIKEETQMFKSLKSTKSTKQTIAEAQSAYNTQQNKAAKKAAKTRRKLFEKFFKKIAKDMKRCGHYTLSLEEMTTLNSGWKPWGLDVHGDDKDRTLRNDFDNRLEMNELKQEHGFYTGQLREFLLEARESGLVIKHCWTKSNTFTGWTVSGIVFSFPRDKK